VVAVESGSEALDAVQGARPRLVVTHAWAGDMDGCTLFSRLRSHPERPGIPVLFLSGLDEGIAAIAFESGVDMICPGHVSVTTLLTRVRELAGDGPVPVTRAAASEALDTPDEPVAGSPPPAFQGSLAVMDLPAVAQVLALGAKWGRLELSLPVGEGLVEFEAGQPVHAEFAGGAGDAAFAALLWATQATRAGEFRFIPGSEADGSSGVRTIHRSVEGLLLDAAAWLDEEQPAPGRVVAGGRA
jgi:CheY-like chemotaxis protein